MVQVGIGVIIDELPVVRDASLLLQFVTIYLEAFAGDILLVVFPFLHLHCAGLDIEELLRFFRTCLHIPQLD